jgi:hypothetical protein
MLPKLKEILKNRYGYLDDEIFKSVSYVNPYVSIIAMIINRPLLNYNMAYIIMIIYIDIDDTICFKSKDYSQAKPFYINIKKVNKLYHAGHTIVMWTARGTLTNKSWFATTYDQLKQWKVMFHELRMGKPAFDLFIDDRVLNSIHHWDQTNINTLLGKKPNNVPQLTPDRSIGDGHPCLIIAEIGQNHQGSVEMAKKMISMVKECGADVAKFQKTTIAAKFNANALARPYTGKNSWGETYGEHKRYLEFTDEEFIELKTTQKILV